MSLNSNTSDATSGVGTVYLLGAHEFAIGVLVWSMLLIVFFSVLSYFVS